LACGLQLLYFTNDRATKFIVSMEIEKETCETSFWFGKVTR